MRPSKRSLVLDGALAIVADRGVDAVTFDAVAEHTGLTKGGILYHFPTRDELLHAMHEYLAARWEADMTAAAEVDPETLTDQQRLAAYASVATRPFDRAELRLILESSATAPTTSPWSDVLHRWTPPVPTATPLTPEQTWLLTVRLAADGLSVYEALTGTPLDPQVQKHLAEHIAQLAKVCKTLPIPQERPSEPRGRNNAEPLLE